MEMAKIKNWCRISAVLMAVCGVSAYAQAKELPTNMAKLQAMDKITGRVNVIEVPVNAETKFGSFSIVVRACKTRPPEETPDNYAFVDVVDEQLDGKVVNIFKGWMISSSPALNAIEHPIYDVWLLQCFDGDVSKAKILSEEELRARDEIIMERDPTSAGVDETEPQSDGEPEDLIKFETSSEEDTAQPLTAEKTAEVPQTAESPAPSGDESGNTGAIEANASADTKAAPQEQTAPLPAEIDVSEGTVFETEAAYNIDGEPQELLPTQSSDLTSSTPEVASESAPMPRSDNSSIDLQEAAFENIQVLEPATGSAEPVSENMIQNQPAMENLDFGTPEEFAPEDEVQMIELDSGQYQTLPELNM